MEMLPATHRKWRDSYPSDWLSGNRFAILGTVSGAGALMSAVTANWWTLVRTVFTASFLIIAVAQIIAH
jgi:hypothetical protein